MQKSDWLQQLRQDLHDLCQPLMVLSWRLEVEVLQAEDQQHGETMQGMRAEIERIRQIVTRMRETLHDAAQEPQGSKEPEGEQPSQRG